MKGCGEDELDVYETSFTEGNHRNGFTTRLLNVAHTESAFTYIHEGDFHKLLQNVFHLNILRYFFKHCPQRLSSNSLTLFSNTNSCTSTDQLTKASSIVAKNLKSEPKRKSELQLHIK